MSFPNRLTINDVMAAFYGFKTREAYPNSQTDRLAPVVSIIGTETLQQPFAAWLLRYLENAVKSQPSNLRRLAPECSRRTTSIRARRLEGFVYDGESPCSRFLSASDLPIHILHAAVRQLQLPKDETTFEIADLSLRLLALTTFLCEDRSQRMEKLIQLDIMGADISILLLFTQYQERSHNTPFTGTGCHWFF